MSTSGDGPRAEPDDPDAVLLRRLARQRKQNDGALREEQTVTELLARHEPNIRRIAAYRLRPRRASAADLNQVVNDVFLRLMLALENKHDFRKPFRYVVADNIDWAVKDLLRKRQRRSPEQELTDEHAEEICENPPRPSFTEEAEVLRARIETLGERDRAIITERMLFGLAPEEIAKRHGMTRGALDTATSRALRRLLERGAVDDL